MGIGIGGHHAASHHALRVVGVGIIIVVVVVMSVAKVVELRYVGPYSRCQLVCFISSICHMLLLLLLLQWKMVSLLLLLVVRRRGTHDGVACGGRGGDRGRGGGLERPATAATTASATAETPLQLLMLFLKVV